MIALALQQYSPLAFTRVTTKRTKWGLSDWDVQARPDVVVSSAALSQPEPRWLPVATGKILELCSLSRGWDGYGGIAVDHSIAAYALQVLSALPADSTPEGSVHPLSGGGLQVEWHRNGKDLEITFYAPYEIEATFVDAAGHEQVVNVQDDVTPLRELVAQIAG